MGDIAIGYGASTGYGFGYAIAVGYGASASNISSTAVGAESQATGYQSSAFGQGSTASSVSSTAVGTNSTASNVNSTALGSNSIAAYANSVTFPYNISLGINTNNPTASLDVVSIEKPDTGSLIAQFGSSTQKGLIKFYDSNASTSDPPYILVNGVKINKDVVTSNAQPNITSVGTLTGLTVYGSVLSNVLNIGSNIGNVLSNNVIILSNTGNIYASNALQTTNVFATTINTNTLNVTSLVVSGTITGSVSTVSSPSQPSITRVGTLTGLTVYGSVLSNVLNIGSNIGNVLSNNVIILSNTGNIYASNALQTKNVFANTINANTLNVTSIFTSQIGIGIGPGASLGGSILSVQGSGITITTGGSTYTGGTAAGGFSQFYTDLYETAPYLQPTLTNSGLIQIWLARPAWLARSYTSSTAGFLSIGGGTASRISPMWMSQNPAYSNVLANVFAGGQGTGSGTSTSFSHGLLLPNGRVLFCPANGATGFGMYNPLMDQYSDITVIGSGTVSNYTGGGTMAPNGTIILPPVSNTVGVGIYNFITTTLSTGLVIGGSGVTGSAFNSCLTDGFGNMIFIPGGASNIVVYSAITDSIVANLSSVCDKGKALQGGVLLPTGNVVVIPSTHSNIGMINVTTAGSYSYSNMLSVQTAGTRLFCGGVLAPSLFVNSTISSNIILVPFNSPNVCIFNPSTITLSNTPTGIGATGSAFQGGCLLPSGNVIFAPCNSSNVGMFDPFTLQYSNSVNTGVAAGAFKGATLIQDGRVVFCPAVSSNVGVLHTMIPPPSNPLWARSSYLNKF
jgi:hypothetical protein